MKVPKWWTADGLKQKTLFDQVRKNFQNCEPLEEMGVEVYQLARCYHECFKENIPVAQLGFSSLGELLFHCDDILQVRRARPAGRLHVFLKRGDAAGGGRYVERYECLESSVLLNVFSCVPDSPANSLADLKEDGSNKVRPMRKPVPSMEIYVPPSRRLKNSNCPIPRNKKIPPSAFIHENWLKDLGLYEQENAFSIRLHATNVYSSNNLTSVDTQGLARKDGWSISWNEVVSTNCVNSAEQPILVPTQRPAVEENHESEASELPTPRPRPTSSGITKETGQILGFDTYGHVLIRFSDSKNAVKCVLKGLEKLMYTSQRMPPFQVRNGEGREAEIEIHHSCHPFFLVPLISITSSVLDCLQNGNQSDKDDEQLDPKFQASDKQSKIRHFLLQSGYISFGLKNLIQKC